LRTYIWYQSGHPIRGYARLVMAVLAGSRAPLHTATEMYFVHL
jgi:hypothetical protein